MAVAIRPEDANDDVFDELYRDVRGPLVAYCRRYAPSTGDAEALAQEALFRAWRSWDRDSGRPLWPWVLTVARNLAIDEHRRTGRRNELAARRGRELNRFANPEDAAVDAAERDAVRLAFEALPERYQRVVQLHHVEGRSYQEIADIQDVSTETVRGMLRRARHAMRIAYARFDAVPVFFPFAAVLRSVRHMAGRFQVRMAQLNAPTLPVEAVRTAAVAIAIVMTTSGAAPTLPRQLGGGSDPAQVAAPPATSPGRATTSTSTARHAEAGASTTTRPDPDRPDGPAAPGAPLGLIDNATAPEDAYFTQLAPTDNRNDPRTVFAVGESTAGCPTVSCPLLFQSSDGGATWRRLGALGFRGGSVMLPPAWPADRRIFVIGPDALQESTDGGTTFVARTPAGRTGAMSPGFSSGDPVIWVGFAPGWVFHDDTRAVTPLTMWPPPVADYATYAFSPKWPADNRVLLGGWTVGDDGPQSATVSRCESSTCGVPVVLPGLIGSPELLAAPSFARTGTAFAWNGRFLFRTDDGGHSYTRLRLPGPGKVSTLVATRTDRLYMALADVTVDGPVGGLYVSDDHGSTWRPLGAGTAFDQGVSAVAALGNGNLLAAMQPVAGGGLRCSSDGGATWRRRC